MTSSVSQQAAHHLVAAALARGAEQGPAHDIAARAIVDAELRGRGAFGVSMLRALLDDPLLADGGGAPTVLRDRSARVDLCAADRFAPVVLAHAALVALDRAAAHGVGIVVVHAPGMLGQLGEYVRTIADAGCVGLLAVGAPPMVAPFGGTGAALGTNPFALAIPASGGPIVVDAVTSALTRASLRGHQASGAPLPAGTALDADGRPTLDPASVAALLPRDGALLSSLAAIAVEGLSNAVAGIDASDPGRRAATIIAFDGDGLGDGASSRAVGDDLATRLVAAGGRPPGRDLPAGDVLLPDWLTGG